VAVQRGWGSLNDDFAQGGDPSGTLRSGFLAADRAQHGLQDRGDNRGTFRHLVWANKNRGALQFYAAMDLRGG
jgi:hypothetical protein